MSPVIRVSNKHSTRQATAYNFGDMAQRAETYIETVRTQARREAQRILSEAREEAARLRQEALQEARQEAQAELEQAVAARLATVLPAFREVSDQLDRAKEGWLAHWERTSIHVAGVIATKLIRKRIDDLPEVTANLLREALQLAAGEAHIRIVLSTDDRKAIEPQIPDLVREMGIIGDVDIVEDPALGPGECRVETEYGIIDQSFRAQLDRIEQELCG